MGKIIQKINKELEKRKIEKTYFAEQIGVSRDTVYNWTDENIKASVLKRVSAFLDIPIGEFLHEDNSIGTNTDKKSVQTLTSLVADIKNELVTFRHETISILKAKKK